MQCNIDRRGRRVRLVMGAVTVVVAGGLLLGAALLDARSWWPWAIGVGGVLVGAFGVVEGLVGWCAMRAMGFRTRL